jgi:uncharacterized protein (TIGR03000 family)
MFRKLLTVAAVTALGLWVGVRPVQAQDWPGRYDIDGGGYYADEERDYVRARGPTVFRTGQEVSPRVSPVTLYAGFPYSVAPGSYYAGAPVYSAPSYTYGSFSPEQTAAYYDSVEADRAAVIDVRLPAGALMLFDGHKTTSTGPERRFVSPPLTPGKEYVYEVTVRWQEGGRQVTRTRSLPVRAGERQNIAFGPEARQ